MAVKDLGIGYGDHYPAASKVYAVGARAGVRVPLREVALTPTRRPDGSLAENPRVHLYDTSGPWTDAEVRLDVREGLPALREDWIEARGDTECYEGRDGRHERDDRSLRFPGLARTRRRGTPADPLRRRTGRRGPAPRPGRARTPPSAVANR